MNQYIFNIFIIIFTSSVILLIIPHNKFEKLTKTVLGLIIIISVFSPIIKSDILNVNVDDVSKGEETSFQNGYLYYVKKEKDEQIQKEIVDLLNDVKIEKTSIISDYDEKYDYVVKIIEIYLQKEVIIDMDKNINIIDKIKSFICNAYKTTNDFEVLVKEA